ncbi:hypothetical protein P8452_61779 [Trifolium repens]|nr:hypothetical protein P8452_61779 [Trifolium repens]
MRDIYEYVVYCGPWLAEVNKLSIQPWDKISNFFLISLFCFGIEDMPYGDFLNCWPDCVLHDCLISDCRHQESEFYTLTLLVDFSMIA